MTGVGIDVREESSLDHNLRNLIPDKKCAHRLIGTGKRLGRVHEIRVKVPELAAKPLTQASIAGDDLIGHEKNRMASAQLPQISQVPCRRNNDSTRPLHRFYEHGRNGLGIFPLDELGRFFHTPAPVFLMAHVRISQVVMGRGAMDEAVQRQVKRFQAGRNPGHAGSGKSPTVVAVFPAQDLGPPRPTGQLVVETDQFQGRLIPFRARAAEIDVRQVRGNQPPSISPPEGWSYRSSR